MGERQMLPRQTKSTEWFFIGGLGVFGEEWVVSVQGQGLRVGRQVGIFRQNVVQDADMLDAAFRHQVEEVVLDDGDVVGRRKVPHEHLRDDFKRAVGRVETEQNLPARPCSDDDADARTLHADGADGVGGEHVHRHALTGVAAVGQGLERGVRGQRVGEEGNAGGGKAFLPNLHQRQASLLQVDTQGGLQVFVTVAQGVHDVDRLPFGADQRFVFKGLQERGGGFAVLFRLPPLFGRDAA